MSDTDDLPDSPTDTLFAFRVALVAAGLVVALFVVTSVYMLWLLVHGG